VSKIEAEALEAQLEAAAATDGGVVGTDGHGGGLPAARVTSMKNARQAATRYGEDRVGGSAASLLSMQGCQFHRLTKQAGGSKVTLEPVGPIMHAVAGVSWSHDGKYCALLMDNTISIVSAGPDGGSVGIIGSVHIENGLVPVTSLSWTAGILFVSTSVSVNALFVLPDNSIQVILVASLNKVSKLRLLSLNYGYVLPFIPCCRLVSVQVVASCLKIFSQMLTVTQQSNHHCSIIQVLRFRSHAITKCSRNC
jgi:hypothetical protein